MVVMRGVGYGRGLKDGELNQIYGWEQEKAWGGGGEAGQEKPTCFKRC